MCGCLTSCYRHVFLSAVVIAEAGQPHSVSLRTSGHAAEVAPAGGSRRGRLPDRSGRQRPAGRPDRSRHEGLAQDLKEDGREVGHLGLMRFERFYES